jgi:predicted AAA+ superfamily ATPase
MAVDDFNLQLRERLRQAGKSLINYGYWKGNLTLRYVAANPDAEPEDIDRLFNHILETANQLEEE